MNDVAFPAKENSDLVHVQPVHDTAKDAFGVMSSLGNDSLGEQLLQIEQGMRRLDATMLRIERSNLVSTALFRRLLDWVRTREASREDSA